MDVADRADKEPEPTSIARCQELLGDDADMMSDDEILAVARHAESLAHVVLDLALQTFASTSCHGETTHLAGV
jgi:hypothetical protein